MSLYYEVEKKLKKTEGNSSGSQAKNASVPAKVGSPIFSGASSTVQLPRRSKQDSYIDSFVSEANKYLDATSQRNIESGRVSYSSANNYRRDNLEGLQKKGSAIREYLKTNAYRYDKDSLLNLYGVIDYIDKEEAQYRGFYTPEGREKRISESNARLEELRKEREGLSGFENPLYRLAMSFIGGDEYAVQSYLKDRDRISAIDQEISEIEDDLGIFNSMIDEERIRTLDQNAAAKEIEALEEERKRLEAVDFDWTDASQRAEYEAQMEELDSQINQKQADLRRAVYVQHGEELASVADRNSENYDPEFRQLSQYSSQYENNGPRRVDLKDRTYEWINNQNGFRDKYTKSQNTDRLLGIISGQIPADGLPSVENEFEKKGYDRLNEQEISIYNYYYAKEGPQKAQEYLDSIQETLNRRKAEGTFGVVKDSVALEYLFGVAAGLDQFGSGMEGALNALVGKEEYLPASEVQMASQMIRQDLGDKGWNLGGNSVGQIGYDIITNTANMAPSMMVSIGLDMLAPGVGTTVGSAMMGLSSGGSAYQDAINRGYSKDQARGYGLLVGSSEAVLGELISGIPGIGGRFTDDVLAKFLTNVDSALIQAAAKIGGNALSEFSEEYLQEILTPVFENLALGTDQDIQLLTPEAIYSGILGALTAGILESPGTIYNEVKTYKTGKKLQSVDAGARLAQIGSTYSADSVAHQLAGKVNENTGAYTIGRLFNEINATLTAENEASITRYLTGKGMSEDVARDNARVMAAVIDGGTMSDLFVDIVESNNILADAMREVIINPNSTVLQRSKNYKDVLRELANEMVGAKKSETNTNVEEEETPAQGSAEAPKEPGFKSISSVKNGVKVRLDDDSDVNLKDADISPDDSVRIETIARVNGMTPESADFVFKILKTNTGFSAREDALGAKEAFEYGYHGFSMDHLKKHALFNNSLTDAQRKAIYEEGQRARNQEIEKTTPRKGTGSKSTGIYFDNGGGNVVAFNEGKPEKMKEWKSAGVQTARVLKALGIGGDIYFFESYLKDGKRVYKDKNGNEVKAPNGWYSESDGSIHIDLNAGSKGQGYVLYTLSHELVHFIEQWSPQKYKVLADFLVENYEKGQSMDKLVRAKQAKLASLRGVSIESIKYKEAYSEVIADSMEAMLADGNVMEKLVELKARDNDLFAKMKQFFDNLAAKIRNVYKGQTPDSVEGKAVLEMKDSIEQIQKLFADALVDASENYQNTIGSRNMDDFSAAQNTDGETLFQYRAMEADEDTYRQMLKKWGKMSDVQITNLFTTIDKAMDIIKDNLEALDYAWEADIDDRAFSPVKPNSDSLYQVSLDFSTLCRKRILQQMVQAQLQDALNKPLTRDEGIAIRDALIEIQKEGRQIEVACALCYVESARMKSPEQIKRFMENREKVIKDFFASKSGGDMKAKVKKAETDARERLGVGDKPLKQLPGKVAAEIRAAKKAAKASYVPTEAEQKAIDIAKNMTVTDFTSPEGLENLAKNHRDLFDAYTSYIRNATKSKGIENDTWWRAGDSMKIGDVLIANMNKENGLRSQSWSDFQVIHILDYIASTIELATRNAKEQAYSKVPDYVELMGNTGVMINMSLIPTAEFDGSLRYDSVEGIDYNRSLELRDKYPATAGTICIGVDNKQIQLLLADSTIDYVIPYHRSGMSAHIRKAMHIPTWSEYQDYQSESKLSRAEAQKRAEKYGVKLLDESDPNYQKHTSFSDWFDLKEAQQIAKMENANPSDKAKQKKYGKMYGGYMAMQNAGNNYLKLCAERGLAPKFSHEKADFTAEDNYWKLLIDRKMVNNATGEIIEQQTIKPIFDQGEVLRILNDELERYPKVKADQEYAIRKVTEAYLSGNLKAGMPADAIAKVMQAPVDNVSKTNILSSAETIAGAQNIKRSDRDTESVSNRSLLADALESTVQTDWERRKLQEYKDNISKIEEQEAKLQQLNAQIRELSFAKGPRDKAKLTELRIEATKTTNRINTYDKILLRLEAAKPLQDILARERKNIQEKGKADARKAVADYKKSAELKQQETLREYRALRAETKGIRDDYRIMEKEFIRIAKEYEKLNEKSRKETGKNAQTISDLRKALAAETKKHKNESAKWAHEFTMLLKEYDAADRKISTLEEKIRTQRASAKSKVDSRKKTELRNKITDVIRDIESLYNRGDKKRNVKEGMRDFVENALISSEILFTVNYSDEDIIMNGVEVEADPDETKLIDETQRLIQERKDLSNFAIIGDEANRIAYGDTKSFDERIKKIEGLDKAINQNTRKLSGILGRERSRINNTTVSYAIGQMAESYFRLESSDKLYIKGAFREEVYQKLLDLSRELDGTIIRDMSRKQLEQVYNAYTMVKTTIYRANRLFADNLKQNVESMAAQSIEEIRKVKGKDKRTDAGRNLNTFSWNNEKPVYAFERLGSDTFKKLFGNIRKGQDVWAIDLNEADEFRRGIYKKYNKKSWDTEKTYSFQSSGGARFELTLGQIMSLYAYSKRDQAYDHLMRGGIVFDNDTETVTKKLGIPITYRNESAVSYNLSPEILDDIVSNLTPQQKAFVDDMQQYLSDTMGDKGNEISLQLYGIKLFNEENYFPLRSAGQYMERAKEADMKKQQGFSTIVGAGFAKSVKPNASNPVVLSNFMDVWADHVNEMSMYHAFVLPLEDFRRVYNFSSPNVEGEDSVSVYSVIQNTHGKAAVDYLDQLYRDLNGGALTDNTAGRMNKLMGLFKKGAVFASFSVTIQQPSAIARAFALINPKYAIHFKIGLPQVKIIWPEVQKYAPVAFIKDMGYFDTGMGRSARDYLQTEEYKGVWENIKGFVWDSNFRDDIFSKLPAFADQATWCAIWQMVKRETAAKHPNMDVKSEAFLKLCGERFSEVIDKTQVYDSVLSRSANMRSKDTGMKMVTAFLSEPTTSINMIEDAVRKGRQGDKKYAARAIGAVVASMIFNSALVSLVEAGRDDDDDQTYWEKYLESLHRNLIDGINPATYIPFLKDIISIFQGYDVNRSDMVIFADIYNALTQLSNDKVSGWRKVEDFAGSILKFFGLPAKNFMRDIRTIKQVVETLTNGEKGTKAGRHYAVREGALSNTVILRHFFDVSISQQQQLLEAYIDDDTDHAARIEARYQDEKKLKSAVKSAIRERYLDGDIDKAEAREYLISFTGEEIDDTYWTIKEWDHQNEVGNSEDKFVKYEPFYEAVMSGENLDAVIKEFTDNGVEMETLSSQLSDHFRVKYINAASDEERKQIADAVIEAKVHMGAYRDNAEKLIEEWDFAVEHGGESYDDMVKAYKRSEISREEMIAYMMEVGKTEDEIESTIIGYDIVREYGINYGDREVAYREGRIDANDLREIYAMKNYEPDEIEALIEAHDWLKARPEYNGVYASTVKTYLNPIEDLGYNLEDAGISFDDYLYFKERAADCTGVDSDGDGKADSGTIKQQKLDLINSMNLTREQKDTFYYFNKWSKKSIKKTPWY